jgi:hypothetical protein
MSSLPENVKTALQSLLRSLTSAQNEERSAAETALNRDWIGGGVDRIELLLAGLAEEAVSGAENVS